jgi:hypothetical protein
VPPVQHPQKQQQAGVPSDQVQLLELVQLVLSDHRTSLLERQHLQQQLASAQQALQAERIDKDRAAALADIRWVTVLRWWRTLCCAVLC